MAHGQEKRTALRSGYVHDGLPLGAAAKRLGLPESTARRWKRRARKDGDDWDRARAAASLAGEGPEKMVAAILEDFIRLFQTTLEEVKKDEKMAAGEKAESLSRLADAFSKTIRSAAAAAPELSRLAVAMELLTALGDFVKERFPHHADAFTEILEPFGAELAKQYG